MVRYDFSGKVVLVTGSSRGMGAAILDAFAAAGAICLLNYFPDDAGLFPAHGQANYAAAKAGVIAMTKVMGKELARRGITVNAVAPGIIQTAMLQGLRPEVLAEYEKQIPVGRVGRPEEVAHAVLFFACAESGYITGQTLPITGGWF